MVKTNFMFSISMMVGLALLVTAAEIPSGNVFKGAVIIGGVDAPIDMEIRAYIQNAEDPNVSNSMVMTTKVGEYKNLIVNGFSDDDGKTIIFIINGTLAGQTYVFDHIGDGLLSPPISLNLTVTCINDDTQFCPLQEGVCSGSTKVCTTGEWPTCDYATYSGDYEVEESTCDGMDNDCDGEIDEGCIGGQAEQPIQLQSGWNLISITKEAT